MNQLRVLSLMTLILLSASRLPGQSLGPNPRPCLSHSVPSTCKVIYVQPVVCNDGTISIYVVRAYMDVGFFSGHEPWVIEGWYEVEPGKCSKIGPEQRYTNNKIFGVGYDAVTLLAFAFLDSRGAWGAVKVPVGEAYEPSNQQFCVQDGTFRYTRDSEQSDLPGECDRAPAGSHLISASVAFYGYSFRPDDPSDRDYLHVKLGPNDRAIPLGKQASSGGAAQGPGTNEEFQAVLTDTIRSPGAPRLRGSPAGSFVQVCVLPTVVKKQSWANPQSARTKAVKDAIRQFTASHSFSGGGKARFSVREIGDRFIVEEVKACSDDDDDFNLQSPK
jgi:Protein of unknown function (DUF1036)